MNIFNVLKVYAGSWSVKSERAFSQEEVNSVASARVVESAYGLSVCFMMKSGGQTFIPLSQDSSLGIGDTVDLASAKLLVLEKTGENDIIRVSI